MSSFDDDYTVSMQSVSHHTVAMKIVKAAWGGLAANSPVFPNQSGKRLPRLVRNRVEAAYARSDLFERRRILMHDWERYLAQGAS